MLKRVLQDVVPAYQRVVAASLAGPSSNRLYCCISGAKQLQGGGGAKHYPSDGICITPMVGCCHQFSTTALHSAEVAATKAKLVERDSTESQKSVKPETKELPRLPVPPLDDTLAKFLRSARPLLTNQEFEETVKVVKEFNDGVGPKLQALLEQRAKEKQNWLSEWWLNTAYLEYQDPVVVYSSPGLVFPLEDFESIDDQVRYAAKMVYGALNYKKSIDDNTIAPDRMQKLPLDMSQYSKVLGTNRNPGETRDQLVYYPNSKHYVLAYKNHYFKVNGYSSSGEILKPGEIYQQIYHAINDVNAMTSGLSGIPIGFLTTDKRDLWAKSYALLMKDKDTKAAVGVISEALFLLAIDRPNRPLSRPKGSAPVGGIEDLALSEKQTVAALQMIHGNRTNSGNRWYDKTIQFIVGSEGECGLTYEHSPAEGPPIANMMDYIVTNLNSYDSLLPSKKTPPPTFNSKNLLGSFQYAPEKFVVTVNKKVSTAITESKQRLDKLIDDVDMACFTFRRYGKDFIKQAKFSPDSFIQMAIQAAFYRIHGMPAAHYESASTRMYVDGRTETIRSCSSESLAFSRALCNPAASSLERFKTMKLAIECHKNYAADAVRGFGVDRHLLGLKLAALENKMEIPKLYSDLGYTKSSQFRLSTSQVPSIHQAFMCYGPLVQNGYGCCYNPQRNVMSFGISAFNSSTETNAEKFKIALQETLLDMQTVALKHMPAKL